MHGPPLARSRYVAGQLVLAVTGALTAVSIKPCLAPATARIERQVRWTCVATPTVVSPLALWTCLLLYPNFADGSRVKTAKYVVQQSELTNE